MSAQALKSLHDDLAEKLEGYRRARFHHASDLTALLGDMRDRLRLLRAEIEKTSQENTFPLFMAFYSRQESRPPLRLLLASFFFDVCKNVYFWDEVLANASLLSSSAESASAAYNLFLSAEYLAFMNKGAFSDQVYWEKFRKPLKEWYLYLEARSTLSLPRLKPKRHEKRAAILLRLWRSPHMYTPALEALDYAYELHKKFGYSVTLFNTNLLHDQMPQPVWPLGQFSPLPDSDEGSFSYKDVVFPIIHRRAASLDPTAAEVFWKRMIDFSPSWALAFGDCNLYADALARTIPVLTYHYTSDVPLQIHTIAGYQGDSPHIDEQCAAILDKNCRRMSLKPSATDVPRTIRYSRSQWSLPDYAFVFVIIGNRLRSEITVQLLTAYNAICTACPNAYFVFGGFYDQAEEQLAAFPALRARVKLVPHIEDVRAFMAIADVMLNPERAGGGHAAVQALAEGKPVVSLAIGDVALLLGHHSTCSDLSAYTQYAIDLATNKQMYQEAVQAAQQRYPILVDRSVNLKSILQALPI